jgi:DNA-directed RNA polymerase subunit RPC12/RpoP
MTVNMPDFEQYEALVRRGIIAAKNENYPLARTLLTRAIRTRSGDSRPWVWLAETTEKPEQKRECLERALAINPHDSAARKKLIALSGTIPEDQKLPPGTGVQPRKAADPVPGQTQQTYQCPQCGGHITFEVDEQSLTCQYCGYQEDIQHLISSEKDEKTLDFTLPTERGHQWAQSRTLLACQQCGADSLWPEGQKTLNCPYCGSGQLITSQETQALIEPQGIGLFEISAEETRSHLNEWLGKGWFTPDQLASSIQSVDLRAAYYPFWTFDGTLELHWQCEVNEGNHDHPHWVSQKGNEYEMFDDLLIAGNQSLEQTDIDHLTPFFLDDLLAFRPEYLAGWPGLTYNIPLAKASLAAREKIVRLVRKELPRRVLPHKQKRNLTTGTVNWLNLTYKHVLLPLWTGTYRYQGQTYRVMLNGQTGKVTGEKPQDRFKKTLFILSVLLTLIVLLVFLAIMALEFGWIELSP